MLIRRHHLRQGGRHDEQADRTQERRYEAAFRASGCTAIERIGAPLEALVSTVITFGSLRPATLLVTKPAANG